MSMGSSQSQWLALAGQWACYWEYAPKAARFQMREDHRARSCFEQILTAGDWDESLSPEQAEARVLGQLAEKYTTAPQLKLERALLCLFHRLCAGIARRLTERLGRVVRYHREDFMGWTVAYASEVKWVLEGYKPGRGSLGGWAWQKIERAVKAAAVVGTGYREQSDIYVFLHAPRERRQETLQGLGGGVDGELLHALIERLYVPETPQGRYPRPDGALWAQVAHLYNTARLPQASAVESAQLMHLVHECARLVRPQPPVTVAFEGVDYTVGAEERDHLQWRQLQQTVRRAAQQLPWEGRCLVRLYYGLDLSQVDIAVLLGLPARNDLISTRLNRHRRTLLFALLDSFGLDVELLVPLTVRLWQLIPDNPLAEDLGACRQVQRFSSGILPVGSRETTALHPLVDRLLTGLIRRRHRSLLVQLAGRWPVTETNLKYLVEAGQKAGLLQPGFAADINGELVRVLRDVTGEEPLRDVIEAECRSLGSEWCAGMWTELTRLGKPVSLEQFVEAVTVNLNQDRPTDQLPLDQQLCLERPGIRDRLADYLCRRMG